MQHLHKKYIQAYQIQITSYLNIVLQQPNLTYAECCFLHAAYSLHSIYGQIGYKVLAQYFSIIMGTRMEHDKDIFRTMITLPKLACKVTLWHVLKLLLPETH